MAVPKKRTSKARKRKRRTHQKGQAPDNQACPRCGDLKLPHRVCPSCGYYRDMEVVPEKAEY